MEHHSPSTRLLWQEQGPAESLCYRCADGEYLQLWFGAKGAYEAFLEHMGDPPSEKGYNADLFSGAMVERGERWAAAFATRDRAWWLEDLAGRDFRCEPVLRPGEALRDPGQHHGPERAGPPPLQLEHPQPRQRSRHRNPLPPANDAEPTDLARRPEAPPGAMMGR